MNEQMGLIGRKLGMTQLFDEDGKVIPVTVVQAGPCPVLQVKSAKGQDGYDALQLGFEDKKEQRATKAERGHAQKVGAGTPKVIRELRLDAERASSFEPGQVLTVNDVFEEGQKVDVSGTSKGRGFAGVMKRHNFRGAIRTHGVHEFFRHGGAIGTRLTPGRVLKGKKMPGQMGNEQVTVLSLEVVRVDADRNLLFIKGGVPGPNGGTISVRQAVKG